MADETSGKGVRLGDLRLGSAYEEVGPELGHLHEAHEEGTGKAALVLLPCAHMEWQLESPWRVSISSQQTPSAVLLRVDQAPPAGRTTKLSDALVLMSTAVSKLEDDPRMDAHLAGAPRPPSESREELRRRRRDSWGRGALVGLTVLALGLGVWGWNSGATGGSSVGGVLESHLLTATAYLHRVGGGGMTPIAYRMPDKPLEHQARAPCLTKKDEVEINGGCWMELARKPPCIEDTQAEHQGKCYMPVSKGTPPLQSVNP